MLLCSTYLQTTAVMVIRLTLRLPFQNTYYLIIFVLHFSAVVPHIASIFLEYIIIRRSHPVNEFSGMEKSQASVRSCNKGRWSNFSIITCNYAKNFMRALSSFYPSED